MCAKIILSRIKSDVNWINIIFIKLNNIKHIYSIMIDNELLLLAGEGILFASMQFAIGSVEMSSKFSVKNFSKDQNTLQNAADALSDYLFVAALWTIGLSMLFYAKHGKIGAIIMLITNLIIISWIYFSYVNAFKYAAKLNNLKEPNINLFTVL
jgi:tetrahydromethanopterin S-methyltransferase subunit D